MLGSIQGTPIVKDKSGKGNDGIIRGNPTLVKYNGGWGLSLDGVDDYVEIPDNKNYVVDNGVTGMVWANIDRLATGDEWDHNPLLMKGASISYGTNYLFRMAVRKTGMVTYGVGFNNDNGEYFWNDDENMGGGVTLGKWVQYTGGFDRATGGDSYEDTKASGHTDAPDFDSEIRNWEGKSMYSGFAFHRHLLTGRGRGKTHTMLTGDIGQLRFYTTKLTAEENKQIYANPTAKGPESDKLVVWLDYAPENIVTKGTHTTEWRAMTGSAAKFTYNAEITGAASATATVETSDDGKTVKKEKSAALTSGTGKIDLTGMADAKYVRVKTAFVSDLNSTESSVPVLNEYALTAGKTKIWNTLTDWEKGTFEGAAGHQPGHVYRNYAKDFANYGTIGDVEDSSKAGFTDVANHWAKDAINYVTDKGLMNGTGSNTFSPNASTTRGMLMTVLARYAGEDTAGGATWYEKGMNWAKAKGVSDGTNPTVNITREQLVTMLYRYAGSPAANGSLDSFSDAASVNSYAANAMQWAVANGIVNGLNGKLNPQNNATRAQVAAILMRFCEMSK